MPDIIPGDVSTTATLTPDADPVEGMIEVSYDRDWYALSLTAGQSYLFYTAAYSPGQTMDTTIYLRGAAGNTLRYDDDGGPGLYSRIVFTAATSGTYYLDVGGYSNDFGRFYVGVDIEDFGDGIVGAGSLAVGGGAVQGNLGFEYDSDWFAVNLAAGQMYEFTTQAPDSGPSANTTLHLRTATSTPAFDDNPNSSFSRILFASASGGSYYLDVRGSGTSTGGYGIVANPLADTVANDNSTTRAVQIGGADRTGFLESASDHDWYRVTLSAGERYYFFTKAGTGAAGADTVLTLRDSAGVLLQSDNDALGQYSRITFVAPSAGTYYLDISSNGNGVGSYAIVAVQDDVSGNVNTQATLPLGNVGVSGIVDAPGDRDWFAVDVVAGQSYYFRTQQSGTVAFMDTVLNLRDANGAVISTNDNYSSSNRFSEIAYTANSTGTLYLDVSGYQQAYGAYALFALQDTAGSTPATAGSVGFGGAGAVQGAIDVLRDHDWYGVDLVAGQTYHLYTRAPTEGAGIDTTLTLRDANGLGILFNDDFRGTYSQINFTPSASGRFYLDVGPANTLTGGYGLVVLTENDAIAGNSGTSGSLAIGGAVVEGIVDLPGDHDWYAITLGAGQSYSFSTSDPASGTAVDTLLGIRNAAGVLLGSNDDVSRTDNHSLLMFTAPTDGVYFVDVSASRAQTGAYAFSAVEIPDAIGSTTSTAGTVAIGGTVLGNLDTPNDHDWYEITLAGGRTYNFSITLESDATASNPRLDLRDASGQSIGHSMSYSYIWTGSRYITQLNLQFEATTGGTFYLDANAEYYNRTGPYALSASEEAVSIVGTIATSAVLNIDALPISGLVDWASDHDWFAVTLVAGESYLFQSGAPASGSAVNATLNLRSGTGVSLLYRDSYASSREELFFTATASGTYFVDVSGSYGSRGGYSLSVAREAISGNVSTTETLPIDGTPFFTNIDGIGDRDWFAVSLVAGETYYFYTGVDATGYGGATEMALRASDGSVLAHNDNYLGSASSRIVFTAATSGTYFVDVGGEGNYYSTGYSVAVGHDAIGDTAATAGTLAVGSVVQSSVDGPQDRDWLAVALTAGETYYFYGQDPVGGEGVDARFILRDDAGTLLVSNKNREGLLPVVAFTATTDGTYYLEVAPTVAWATGQYAVGAMVATTIDRLPSSAATGAEVVVDGNARQGAIDYPTDHDWLRVTLTAGQTYVFSTEAPTAGSGLDTMLALRSPSGTVIASNDNSDGTNSALVFTATADGVYFLDVSSAHGGTGAFGLRAETLDVLDPAAIGLRLAGNNGAPHRFDVSAGETLSVDVSSLSAEGQALARAALALWSDASGLVFTETSGGAAITFSDAASGVGTAWTEAGGIISAASVNVGLDVLAARGTGLGSGSMQAYLAAIGQALGLGTPGAYDAEPSYATDAAFANDGWASSVLSAFDSEQNSYFAGLGYTVQPTIAPTAADIVAIQQLYGRVLDVRGGNTIYGFGNDSGRDIFDAAQFGGAAVTIVDSGGIDTLDLSGFTQAHDQVVDLRPQNLSNTGGSTGNLWIARGTRIENALTGLGDDVIYGNNMANELSGGAGDDRLYGAQAADRLFGGDGNDTVAGGTENDALAGNAGNDLIIGGTGRDVANGGQGADLFRFSESDFGGATTASSDIIVDFSQAELDRIDLRRVDAVAGGTDHVFTFIGTAVFSSVAGQLRYELLGGNTYVSGDTDGDGAANFMVRLNGEVTLVAADFVL